jgi:hypothetical protein
MTGRGPKVPEKVPDCSSPSVLQPTAPAVRRGHAFPFARPKRLTQAGCKPNRTAVTGKRKTRAQRLLRAFCALSQPRPAAISMGILPVFPANSKTEKMTPKTTTEPILLKQYKLLGAVIDAPWATRLDHKIARHVIDRYFARYGNARASLRYLEVATGAKRNKIIPSLQRITENGVISIVRQGVGTRPTEYDLNFSFGSKASRGTAEGTSIRGTLEGSSTGSPAGTSTAPSGAHEGTQTYLRNGLTSPLTVGMNEDTPAVPTAPPVSGLEADPAATAVAPAADSNPFEELWKAFPRKHQRAKARAAYTALAPNAELHTLLVASATALAEHHIANGTEKKWWKHLHTWLGQECYLEDLPEPYENAKDAAMARAKGRGPRSAVRRTSTAETSSGLSSKTPLGRHEVVIIGSAMPDDPMGPENRMQFTYRIQGGNHDGKEFSHSFKVLSENEDVAAKGQTIFADIRQATGKYQIDATEELHGLGLRVIVTSMGRIQYEAL